MAASFGKEMFDDILTILQFIIYNGRQSTVEETNEYNAMDAIQKYSFLHVADEWSGEEMRASELSKRNFFVFGSPGDCRMVLVHFQLHMHIA